MLNLSGKGAVPLKRPFVDRPPEAYAAQPKTMKRRRDMMTSLSSWRFLVCILCCSHVITSNAAGTASSNNRNKHKSGGVAPADGTSAPAVDLEALSSELDMWIGQLQSKVSGVSSLLQGKQSAKSDGNGSGAGSDADATTLTARRDALAERQTKLLDRIATINKAQLQTMIDRVNATYEAEIDRRTAWDDTYASCSSSSGGTGEGGDADSSNSAPGTCSPPSDAAAEAEFVPKDALARVLDQAIIMSQSEKKLERWATDMLTKSIDDYTKARIAKISSAVEQVDAVAPTSENPDYDASSGQCVALPDTTSMVFASLHNRASPGGSALHDHASYANGGSIVYGEGRDRRPMTSSPYRVPKSNEDSTRLGDVWWRKFIPEDWEYALDWATDGRWYETKVEDLVSFQGLKVVAGQSPR